MIGFGIALIAVSWAFDGWQVVPMLFIISLFGILVNTVINRPVESMAGLGLALIGIPVYFFWRGKNK